MAVTMGEYSYGSIKQIGKRGDIHVGKFCSIAGNVSAVTVGHDPRQISTYPFNAKEFHSVWPRARDIGGHPTCRGDINIGNDVWIGQNVVFLSGVTVGNGAVIGANSLVLKNIRPYEVHGGNPAKYLYTRFGPNEVKALLRIAWWDWPTEKIHENVADLKCFGVHSFIKKFGGY